MVPQNAATTAEAARILNQALAVQFLEAAKAAHEEAERRIAELRDADNRQIARTIRLAQPHGIGERPAAALLGMDRSRVRRILAAQPADGDRHERTA